MRARKSFCYASARSVRRELLREIVNKAEFAQFAGVCAFAQELGTVPSLPAV